MNPNGGPNPGDPGMSPRNEKDVNSELDTTQSREIEPWAAYSLFLEPHKLRWVARWLEKQPVPVDMDDISLVRADNGTNVDYVASLNYVESGKSSCPVKRCRKRSLL